ncbi:MAG: hypothetical protein U0169_07825 [Polyangiaceae bacterium]
MTPRGKAPARVRSGAFLRPGLVAVVLVAALPGCSRGCLATWLSERGVGPAPQGPRTQSSSALFGIDCPPDLTRCVDGTLERSGVGRVPKMCNDDPVKCGCPWAALRDCPGGCAAPGLVVVDVGASLSDQLCATPFEAVAGPPPPGVANTAAACDDEGYRCGDGVVVHCAMAHGTGPVVPRMVARCLHGCAPGLESMDDASLDDRSAPVLYCARSKG